MPLHFITINCHSLDIQLFNDLYNLVIPLVKKRSSKIIWNVEFDNSPRQHLHILTDHDFRDGEKLAKYIKCKEFTNLIKNTNTILKNCLNVISISNTVGINCWDYRIGYICKETISKRSFFGDLNHNEINEKIDFYMSIERSTKKPHRSDVILITSKNIHTYYELEQQADETLNPENFVHKMLLRRYSFLNISSKQVKLFKDELKFIENPTFEPYSDQIDHFANNVSENNIVNQYVSHCDLCQN